MTLTVEIKKRLGRFTLDIAFEHNAGVLGLLGNSGCGKSMTLKCIAGIVKPDEGRIVLNDRVFFDSEKRINLKPQQRRVGYLFQNYVLFNNMTVEQNIMSGMHQPSELRENQVHELLARFYLTGQEKKYPTQLSGGQQQRVALARMLASQPELIMLDEPFSALDSYLKYQVEQFMPDLFEQYSGKAIYVTHNRDEVNLFCDRVNVLEDGHIVEQLSTEALFQQPGTISSAKLSGCKNFSAISHRSGPKPEIWSKDWHTVLTPSQPPNEKQTAIGVRAHDIRPAAEPGLNRVRIRPYRVVDRLFELSVLAWPLDEFGQIAGENPLRIDLNQAAWQPFANLPELWAEIPPEAILLLEE